MVAFVTIIAVVSGCSDGTDASSPSAASTPTGATPNPVSATVAPPPASPPPSTDLAAAFQQFAGTLPADVGVSFAAVGEGAAPPVSLGTWTHGPAWSTSKVPLTIAALREAGLSGVTDAMRGAIIQSDNAAADQVWQSLGPHDVAAKKVEAVLDDSGAPATVPAERPRAEFSAFGQTDWSLVDQVRFLSWAKCNAETTPIFDLMGHVEGDQLWGLGGIPGAQLKGGWGPSESGKYLVRQIGVIPTPAGLTAVAIAAEPASGSFGDGTNVLTQLSNWLDQHKAELPGGQCPDVAGTGASSATPSGPVASSPDANSVPATSPP